MRRPSTWSRRALDAYRNLYGQVFPRDKVHRLVVNVVRWSSFANRGPLTEEESRRGLECRRALRPLTAQLLQGHCPSSARQRIGESATKVQWLEGGEIVRIVTTNIIYGRGLRFQIEISLHLSVFLGLIFMRPCGGTPEMRNAVWLILRRFQGKQNSLRSFIG